LLIFQDVVDSDIGEEDELEFDNDDDNDDEVDELSLSFNDVKVCCTLKFDIAITFSHMPLSFERCVGAMFIFCNSCTESHSI